MKSSLYSLISIAVVSLVLLWGCGKDFLDRDPPGNLVTETFYKTEDDFRRGMFSVYSALQDMDDDKAQDGAFSRFFLMPDDDVTDATNNSTNLDNFVWNTADPVIDHQYRTLYAGIVRATRIIEEAPGGEMTEEKKKQFVGEAKFVRAFFLLSTGHQLGRSSFD